MSYKVKMNGVEIECGTLEEVRALTQVQPSARKEPEKPLPPKTQPPPRREPYPPPPRKENGESLPPLPFLKGTRVQPYATLDAARAVELAFAKYQKPVRHRQIAHFLTMPVPHGSEHALTSRLIKATELGLCKRLSVGWYVPKDYEPSGPNESINRHTQRNMPGMALPIVRYLIEHPEVTWDRKALLSALQADDLGTSEAAAGVRVWAAKRLGWIDENFRVTDAGLEAATQAETTPT